MRIKSALVLTAFSALAAWATCADARIVIANPVPEAYCTLPGNSKLYKIGEIELVPETIGFDSNGKPITVLRPLVCTAQGWSGD